MAHRMGALEPRTRAFGERSQPDARSPSDQNFFARSDNYALAEKGVVAQTVSSYGLHSDYHQPSDDVLAYRLQAYGRRHRIAAGASPLAGEFVLYARWNAGGKP